MNCQKIKRSIILLFFIILNLLYCSPPSENSPFKLTILHTNDTHGHPAPFDYQGKENVGGIPARYTLIKEIKSKTPNVLVLDAGDVNSGYSVSNLFYAEPDFILMREAGYDAMVVGNHEFDYPLSIIRKQEKWFGKPFLSANVIDTKGNPIFRPYVIVKVHGTPVGILALTTEYTSIIGNPKYVQGISFLNPIETAKHYIHEMKEKTDIIIVLSHLGYRSFGQDRITSREFALSVPDIDVLIDGHTNDLFEKPFKVGNAVVHCARKFGLYLGRVDLEFVGGKAIRFSGKAIPINLNGTKNIPQDPKLSNMLKPYIDKSKELMGEKIGESLGSFPLRRYQESALFNMITDVVKQYTGADIVIQNVGGIRDGFKPGSITRGDVNSVIPFNNEIFVFETKGIELIEILEYAASQYRSNSFAQLSGARWNIDSNSKKILNLTIEGLPVSPEKIYKVATLDYLAEGGDGYIFFKKLSNKNFHETGLFNREILTRHIIEKKRIYPNLDGRLRFKKIPVSKNKIRLKNHTINKTFSDLQTTEFLYNSFTF